MKCIGLTGGVGSGKSTVAELFQTYQIPIIDTDVIARKIVQKGSPVLSQIESSFGSEYVVEGELDRKKLKQLIFNDPKAKTKLEAIMHPVIRQEVLDQAKQLQGPYCLIVIPLLAENIASYDWLDAVIVVDIEDTLQRQRTCARDGLPVELVDKIIQNQASRQTRLAIADYVIDNSQSTAELKAQVKALHSKLLEEIDE